MSQKYISATDPAIITNDLFLAAFLYTVDCTLYRIEKNQRQRVSFVFVGKRVHELREAYRSGPVQIDIRTFRDNLNQLRDLLCRTITGHNPEERSASHVRSTNSRSRAL